MIIIYFKELNLVTIFFNVVKPSIPFLFLVFIKGAFRFNKVYCGHGVNFKNNIG